MMLTQRALHPWPGILFGVAFLSALALGRSASSQLISTDPYDPWNFQYRSFVHPGYINPAMPNQGRYMYGRMGPRPYGSRLDEFYQSLDGAGPMSSPFDMSARGLGPVGEFNADRYYIPNRNDTFFEDQNEREQLYFRAQGLSARAREESDPAKRAQLLKEYQELMSEYRQSTQRATRSAGTSERTRAPSTRGGAGSDRGRPQSRFSPLRGPAPPVALGPGGLIPLSPVSPEPIPLPDFPTDDSPSPRSTPYRPSLLREPSAEPPPESSDRSTPSSILERSLRMRDRTRRFLPGEGTRPGPFDSREAEPGGSPR